MWIKTRWFIAFIGWLPMVRGEPWGVWLGLGKHWAMREPRRTPKQFSWKGYFWLVERTVWGWRIRGLPYWWTNWGRWVRR